MSDDAAHQPLTRDALVQLARARLSDPAYLARVHLRHGTGTGEEGDACAVQEVRRVMRDVAIEAGALDLAAGYSPRTDEAPPCASPLCRTLLISVQDARTDWRAECVGLLHLLPGSAGSEALEMRRAHRMLDWTVREAMPAGLDALAGELAPHDAALAATLREHGAGLRALAPFVDDGTRHAAVAPLHARALDLDLARATSTRGRTRTARALAHARARARARAIDLALALDLDLALSPVPLLRELLAMTEAA